MPYGMMDHLVANYTVVERNHHRLIWSHPVDLNTVAYALRPTPHILLLHEYLAHDCSLYAHIAGSSQRQEEVRAIRGARVEVRKEEVCVQ